MNSALENEVLRIAEKSISEAIVKNLTDYSGPLRKLCERVVDMNADALGKLINDEMGSLINSTEFRHELKSALNAKIARTLIDRMGGEVEKRVNELKADPTTRARITLAIQEALR